MNTTTASSNNEGHRGHPPAIARWLASPLPPGVNLNDYNPSRSPAWRWEEALELHRSGRQFRPKDDPATCDVVCYLRALGANNPQGRTDDVRQRWPELTAAHDLHVNGGMFRAEAEARILAQEPMAVVAAKTGILEPVLAVYVQVFFNVLKGLNAMDWLFNHVLEVDTWMSRPLTETDVWKYMALAGGPMVVDVLVADYHGRPEPMIADRHLQAEQRARFCVREYVESRLSPIPSKELLARWQVLYPDQFSKPAQDPDTAYLQAGMDLLRIQAGLPPLFGPKPKNAAKPRYKATKQGVKP